MRTSDPSAHKCLKKRPRMTSSLPFWSGPSAASSSPSPVVSGCCSEVAGGGKSRESRSEPTRLGGCFALWPTRRRGVSFLHRNQRHSCTSPALAKPTKPATITSECWDQPPPPPPTNPYPQKPGGGGGMHRAPLTRARPLSRFSMVRSDWMIGWDQVLISPHHSYPEHRTL